MRIRETVGDLQVVEKEGTRLLLSNKTVQSWQGLRPKNAPIYHQEIANAVPLDAPSVLMLGVAGGTVGRLLRARGFRGELIGVEPDRTMRRLGAAYFNTALYFNAVVEMAPKRDFSVVIDDAYDGYERVAVFPQQWLEVPNGILIENTIADGRNKILVTQPYCGKLYLRRKVIF